MRVLRVLPLVALGLLAGLPVQGQAPAFLVKDINPSQPEQRVIQSQYEGEGVGGLYYFVADDGTHGAEVWRTDGTAAGTFLVKDICPGDCTFSPHTLTGSNGLLFFIVEDVQHGPQLWKSDGTPEGTSLVKDDLLPPETESAEYAKISLQDAGGKLFFTALSASGSLGLWVTDGTAAGTHPLKPFNVFDVRGLLAAAGGKVLLASQGTRGSELWVSDGTDLGTVQLAAASGSSAVAAPWGGFVFVSADGVHGEELWRTDGTPDGTSLVLDIVPGSDSSSPYGLTAVNGKVVFAATDPTHGTEIWATDGTPAGTLLLRDVAPGPAGSHPQEVTAAGGKAFFRALDSAGGFELWATDGTPAGTGLVKSLSSGPGDAGAASFGYSFTPVGNHLLFFLSYTFWTSDGTAAGTQPVTLPPGSWPALDHYSLSHSVSVAGGRLFFLGPFPPEVWVTDGTPAGSYQVQAIPSATSSMLVSNGSFSQHPFADLNGKLFFQATDGVSGAELWRSDGTAAGTSLVKDLTGDGLSSDPEDLHAVNGRLVFRTFGYRLGLSDGTAAGTQTVPDLPAYDFGVLGNQAFFLSGTSDAGPGLWKTDGTEAGTVQVAPLPVMSIYADMIVSGGKLFFATDTYPGSSCDLFVSDGTGPGTLDITPVPILAPSGLTDVNGTLFFFASLPDYSRWLWKSDGTKGGTIQVKSVQPGNGPFAALPGGILLFTARDAGTGLELWRSDGTEAGTVLVKDINPGPAGSRIRSLTAAGNQVFFVADDGVHGLELWVSDGTAAGTHMVKDLVPGGESSLPHDLTAIGSVLVFSANDGAHGDEAWRSDGTGAGTWQLADVAPGPLSSSPLSYVLSGKNLFFTANDNTTGFELWAIPKRLVTGTFADVPPNYWAWRFVEALAAHGVSSGCGGGDFCPDAYINRAQMAVFVLTARGTAPPPATGTHFNDVPPGYWAGPWIEELASEGVVSGCSANPPLYCPDSLLTRAEMAVLLTVARGENPPPPTGTRFADVPSNYWAARFIEQLAADGITSGCGGGNYCPDQPITRGEMAVFLATAFHLPLP